MIAPQAANNRNQIARMLAQSAQPLPQQQPMQPMQPMMGAGMSQQQQPIVPQQPMMGMGGYTPPQVTAPTPVAYNETGFGYGEKLTPYEEIGMGLAGRTK